MHMIRTLALVALLALCACARQEPTPPRVAPGKVEVIEVIWLACPHCYALEPFIRNWLKTKPAYVEFMRVPVMWGPVHRAHARLYYTFEALGRDDLVSKAMDTISTQH